MSSSDKVVREVQLLLPMRTCLLPDVVVAPKTTNALDLLAAALVGFVLVPGSVLLALLAATTVCCCTTPGGGGGGGGSAKANNLLAARRAAAQPQHAVRPGGGGSVSIKEARSWACVARREQAAHARARADAPRGDICMGKQALALVAAKERAEENIIHGETTQSQKQRQSQSKSLRRRRRGW